MTFSKGEKKSLKEEEKRLKAGIKVEKKRAELDKVKSKYSVPETKTGKWYKNPDWVRAIASIIAIVLTILGFLYFR